MSTELVPLYRVIDANLNRLREALRVIEEIYRFVTPVSEFCIVLKKLRHLLIEIERDFEPSLLLGARDTNTDCFASESRPEEMDRSTVIELLMANFKRAQEASRVIEEFTKITGNKHASKIAKKIRFELYATEKHALGKTS